MRILLLCAVREGDCRGRGRCRGADVDDVE